ncbi:MAG: sugar phosphate isomerase/epimerase family protein [bacterium]
MFKLGIISDEVSQDFDIVVKFAKKNQLDFVEIRTVWDKSPQDLTPSDIRNMKEILNRSGMVIRSIASPVFKCHINKEAEYHQHLEILKRCIDLAHQLNTDILRIFTFWKKETTSLEGNWNLLIDRFGPAIDLAKQENIRLAIENEHSCLISIGKELCRFLDALDNNPKSVYALWDPCNEIFAGITEPPYPNGYESIATRMIHLHIKDAIRVNPKSQIQNPKQNLPQGGEPKCVPIGDGWIDWEEQFKALITNNYNGGASLETHWRPQKELSESKLNRPGGSEFSSLGEEASQICIDRITDIIAHLI